MYDICHPTYYKMSQLGCTDQVKLTTAFYVYMELCEVKLYWDVDYKYCESLQLFYLEARKTKKGALDTFIPWPAIHNLSLELISNIQQELKKDKFSFVFKEGDTTSVYYSICSGIVKPISPEETKELRQKEIKKYQLEMDIKRNTANLYERALSLEVERRNDVPGPSIETEKHMTDATTTIKIDSTNKTDFELKICSDPVDENSEDKTNGDDANNVESNGTGSKSGSASQDVDIQESESV